MDVAKGIYRGNKKRMQGFVKETLSEKITWKK